MVASKILPSASIFGVSSKFVTVTLRKQSYTRKNIYREKKQYQKNIGRKIKNSHESLHKINHR